MRFGGEEFLERGEERVVDVRVERERLREIWERFGRGEGREEDEEERDGEERKSEDEDWRSESRVSVRSSTCHLSVFS